MRLNIHLMVVTVIMATVILALISARFSARRRAAANGRSGPQEIARLQRMRAISLVEGCTLLVLVFVAAPLKYMAGHGFVSTIFGPVHGVAFIVYLWMLIQTVAGGVLLKRDAIRMTAAGLIPFGAFFNERILNRRLASLIKTG